MDGNDAAVQAYYSRDEAHDRLDAGLGRVEFARTITVISRTIPRPPAIVLDMGAGPGRYTDWLLGAGYDVFMRDVVRSHVESARGRHPTLDAKVGDARSIDLPDATVDAVLLLGPLYHLPERRDRLAALREAGRVTKSDGIVFAAAISRWASRIHGMLVERAHERYPELADHVEEMERTGWMRPLFDGAFTGYSHTPADLLREVEDGGLEVVDLVSVEGPSVGLHDLDARMDDDDERRFLLETLAAIESVPELLGVGPHLLVTARVRSPQAD